MAIDPETYGKFRDSIDEYVGSVPGVGNNTQKIINDHIDPVLDEYDDLLRGERPPRLYIFGRTGAGKSSLVNALANKEVTSVGAVEPETVESELYNIEFSEEYLTDWEVVDSRGLFESVSPDGGLPEDTKQFMQEDIEEYRPDVLLHVITPEQVRGGKNDFEVVKDLKRELDNVPPIVFVLNKVDQHLSPGEYLEPENNPELSGLIQRNLEFVSDIVSDVVLKDDFGVNPFDKDEPFKGHQFDSKEYIGVIPVYAKESPYWNIDTLSLLIGEYLPDDSRLQFFQAQERATVMRNLARDITKSTSIAAARIGGAPTSYADIIPITAIQYVQVALIAGLSCRKMERKTVAEFMTSMGFVAGGALVFREIARGLIQFIPGAGHAVSASVAGGGTYAIGWSAERYFFDDVVEEPENFMEEGKEMFADPDGD